MTSQIVTCSGPNNHYRNNRDLAGSLLKLLIVMMCVWSWHKPVEVGVVVIPVRQCAGAVHREALVEYMEGHVLKSVVVQCHLEVKMEKYVRLRFPQGGSSMTFTQFQFVECPDCLKYNTESVIIAIFLACNH